MRQSIYLLLGLASMAASVNLNASHAGGEKQITCPDGTTRTCHAGTRHCYDNDATLCAPKPEVTEFAQAEFNYEVNDFAQTEFNYEDYDFGLAQTGTTYEFAQTEYGEKKAVKCEDGTVRACNAGT